MHRNNEKLSLLETPAREETNICSTSTAEQSAKKTKNKCILECKQRTLWIGIKVHSTLAQKPIVELDQQFTNDQQERLK